MPTRPRPAALTVVLTAALAASTALASTALAADPVLIVQPGDTLSEIAVARGLSMTELVALNGLRDPDLIVTGQRLRLPPRDRPAPATPATPAPAPIPAPVTHPVTAGEHLTSIAEHYGTTIDAIARANGLADPSYIRSGQVLTIPGARPDRTTPAPAPAPAPVTHRVAAGEHLTGIAAHYGTTIDAIARANGLADPSYIRSGQVITVPGAQSSPGAAAQGTQPGPGDLVTDGMPSEMAALVARRSAIGRLVGSEAQRQGVDPAFAMAVAWQESGWQADVVSWAGAVGVMQLLPATADWVGTTMLGEAVNPFDARSNVRAGVTLLRHYLDRYGGDRALVLAAYYQGQTAADRHGVYAVTRPYVASILALLELFAG